MPHPLLGVDPRRDLEQLELEFTLADLGVVEKRVEKLRTSGRHGTPAEREANERELEVLERILPALTEGRPIRDLGLSADDELRIRGFRFLTEKPVLVLLNVGEADLGRADELAGEPAARRSATPARASCRSRPASRWRSASSTTTRRRSSATTSASRAPAWSASSAPATRCSGSSASSRPVPTRRAPGPSTRGATAVDAAGAIHSDLARGFIRAEVIGWQELLELGSMAEAKRHGKVRSEGRTYQVQDGDVIEILFNV